MTPGRESRGVLPAPEDQEGHPKDPQKPVGEARAVPEAVIRILLACPTPLQETRMSPQHRLQSHGTRLNLPNTNTGTSGVP
jgi:hypothetical protein